MEDGLDGCDYHEGFGDLEVRVVHDGFDDCSYHDVLDDSNAVMSVVFLRAKDDCM